MVDLTNLKNVIQSNTIAIGQVKEYVAHLKTQAAQALDPAVLKQMEDQLKENNIEMNALLAAATIND